ncbi:MAG: hypothetical protein RIS09_452 [Actinomycetota bacterium]|jgi:hypothetical protein
MSIEIANSCLDAYREGKTPDSERERDAILWLLNKIEAKIPGKSVELRIPPYAVISVIQGPVHRRGTPRAVVEMNAETLLKLSLGTSTWEELEKSGKILASGERSNLSGYFPL